MTGSPPNDDRTPNPDAAVVEQLLGRPPQGEFDVVVRGDDGEPLVIRNSPLMDDGRPMPTRYWLVDPDLRRRVGQLESAGGVRQAENDVDPVELQAAHDTYATEREGAIPADYVGPRPYGGVGGTRRGVKCLHTHYAYFLAGGEDPIGRWVHARIEAVPDRDAPIDDHTTSGRSTSGAATPADREADREADRGSDPASVAGDSDRPVAAIDCGTNSVRLLVRASDGTTLDRLMRITRLGRGVDQTGRLEPSAIDATIDVLREYRDVMDRHGVGRVRIAATSASRDAENRDEFFAAAEAVVGARPELLSGEEEGRLSFIGATADVDPALGPFLVVDIGGGSTEFTYGTSEAESSLSLDMGCVRLSERFILSDPPKPEELAQALSVAELFIDDVIREIPESTEAATFLGLAGTVSTTAAVEIGLAEYDRDRIHHFELTRAAVEDVFRTLATETIEERKRNPGMEAQRADVIVGGLCVLVMIMRRFGFDRCLVSESDILDGLAMSIASPPT